MKSNLYIILCLCLLLIQSQSVQSQSNDSNSLVLKLYSGFGEHTIKPKNRIIYKIGYMDGYKRAKISYITADTIMLTNHEKVPIKFISEIGYYSKQDKVIKYVGAGFIVLAGFLAYRFTQETYTPHQSFISQIGGLGWTAIPIAMGTAMLTLKRRLYKIPNPWQLQPAREIHSKEFNFK